MYDSQSNGLAERAVQSVECIVRAHKLALDIGRHHWIHLELSDEVEMLAVQLDQAFLDWKARVGKLADHSVQGRGKSRQVSSRIGLVGCCGSKDKAIDHDWHNNEFNTATHQPRTGLGCCGTKDKFAHHPQHQKDFKNAM